MCPPQLRWGGTNHPWPYASAQHLVWVCSQGRTQSGQEDDFICGAEPSFHISGAGLSLVTLTQTAWVQLPKRVTRSICISKGPFYLFLYLCYRPSPLIHPIDKSDLDLCYPFSNHYTNIYPNYYDKYRFFVFSINCAADIIIWGLNMEFSSQSNQGFNKIVYKLGVGRHSWPKFEHLGLI